MKTEYKKVIATAPDNRFSVYLSMTNQMDRYLEDGYTLWYEKQDGSRELLASPSEGFVQDRPEIEAKIRFN